jgi:hypothetical protein
LSEIGFGETVRPVAVPPFTVKVTFMYEMEPSAAFNCTVPGYVPVPRSARLEAGLMTRVAGSVPEVVIAPLTSSHEFALEAVAVKLVVPLVLDTVTFVACGRLPPEVYVHGIEVWLSCKLPLEVTLKVTAVSTVTAPTVTLRMPE